MGSKLWITVGGVLTHLPYLFCSSRSFVTPSLSSLFWKAGSIFFMCQPLSHDDILPFCIVFVHLVHQVFHCQGSFSGLYLMSLILEFALSWIHIQIHICTQSHIFIHILTCPLSRVALFKALNGVQISDAHVRVGEGGCKKVVTCLKP